MPKTKRAPSASPQIASERLSKLRFDHLSGHRAGIYAVCSAHAGVLAAAMKLAASENDVLLIEATANQVNQFGGYTGMNPADFSIYVCNLATAAGFPFERILLGADHLGPHIWKNEPAEKAMAKAVELVRQYVAAGFHKIHFDTGSGCADDPASGLSAEVIAQRTVALCEMAETAAKRLPDGKPRPLYVIGAEVPPPGGALENPDQLAVTTPGEVLQTLTAMEGYFAAAGLESAWERVMAVVVQPGVEFGDDCVATYRPDRVRPLADYHAHLPGRMTYEIHSTDYQSAEALKTMARDHFILMKAGPCLTNAFREAIFALAHIESEWLTGRRGSQLSGIRECLETVMRENPKFWQSHYRGTSTDQKMMRAFSQRDRIRYYWRNPAVATALKRLLANLKGPIPSSLLSQYFPDLYPALGSGALPADPSMLIERRIQRALAPYVAACR